ncbi:MAG: flavodoxin [Chitinophagales bacterium]
MKIGLFYGTDTGNTETIAKDMKKRLEAMLGEGTVDLLEIYKKTAADMAQYNFLILGMPTWYDGELQSDWEAYIPEMEQVDFTGKKVAFFGLGDQYGYADYFCDALGVFATIVEQRNGTICGFTSVKGFEHTFSKAQRGDQFVGLCLDVDNQDELTNERLEHWLPLILEEFGIRQPA